MFYFLPKVMVFEANQCFGGAQIEKRGANARYHYFVKNPIVLNAWQFVEERPFPERRIMKEAEAGWQNEFAYNMFRRRLLGSVIIWMPKFFHYLEHQIPDRFRKRPEK